jgi:hypothetical protein
MPAIRIGLVVCAALLASQCRSPVRTELVDNPDLAERGADGLPVGFRLETRDRIDRSLLPEPLDGPGTRLLPPNTGPPRGCLLRAIEVDAAGRSSTFLRAEIAGGEVWLCHGAPIAVEKGSRYRLHVRARFSARGDAPWFHGWDVVDAVGRAVLEGDVPCHGPDWADLDDVRVADHSTSAGILRISVEGIAAYDFARISLTRVGDDG